MRQKLFFISTILVTLIMSFNSCTLFIDDDELFNTSSEPLPKYQGKGYDEPVTGKGEYVDVTYQLYESTMTIQPEDELTNYIHRVDTMGYLTVIHIDKNVPKDLVPKIGQMIVSGNIDLFPHHGLCDMVYSIEESNGELLVKSALSEPQYAFKEMQIHTHIPTKGLFEEYEVFDEDGKSLGVINQKEELVKVRANRVKDVNGMAKRFQDKDYDINFNTWIELLKKISGTILDDFKEQKYKNKLVSWDISINGGINFPKTDIEANLNPFSDDPMFVNVSLGRGDFEAEINASINIGMDKPKYFDFLPNLTKKLNTPKAFMIGPFPVVIVPNIFAQVGFQAKAGIHIVPWLSVPWGDEYLQLLEMNRGTKQNRSSEFGLDIDGEGEFGLYFLVNLGLGLYTDAVTFNAQPQIRWNHVLRFGTGDLISTKDQKTTSNTTYKNTLDIGIGLKIIADGGSLKDILAKIKKKLDKYLKILDKASEFANNYYKTGTMEQWNYYNVHGTFPQDIDEDVKKEMEAIMDKRQTFDEHRNSTERQKIAEKVVAEKARDKQKVDEEMDVRNGKRIHKTEKDALNKKTNKEKKFELEFGPWWPAFLNLITYQRYWYPKIKDKSFHVGASSEGGKFKMAASYQLEDHGLKSLKGATNTEVYWWVPGFEIKSGSTLIDDVMAGRGNGTFNITKIDDDTPNDQRVTCTFKDLNYPEETLTCVPYFALWREAFMYGGEFVDRVYDDAITFSVTTPSMAITKIQLTEKPTRTVDENHKETYHAKFNVIVKIRGTSNIADWGIRENNSDSKNKYKSSSLASPVTEGDERSGEVSYVMEYSISSENLVANVSLTPYCFLTGQNTSDPKKAKYFADFINEFDFGEWFTSSTGDDNYSHTNNYTLTLESVKCISTDDELSEEEDDYDYDEEE